MYGLWIESYLIADPVTYLVTEQSSWVLNFFYNEINYENNPSEPTVWMSLGNRTIISVFEGCNGINVMILYVAFIFAYRGPLKHSIIYSLIGLIIIHLSNIFRISVLFWVAEEIPKYMYFTHKYLFTGIIYAAVFLLWFIWIKYFSLASKKSKTHDEFDKEAVE